MMRNWEIEESKKKEKHKGKKQQRNNLERIRTGVWGKTPLDFFPQLVL